MPETLNIAFNTAGAVSGTAASPIRLGGRSLGKIWISISGRLLLRMMG